MKTPLSSLLVPLVITCAGLILLMITLSYLFEQRNEYIQFREVEDQKKEKLAIIRDEIDVERRKITRFTTDKEFVKEVAHREGLLFKNEIRVEFED